MTDPDLKTLWQNQPTEYDPMTLEEIRRKARAFQGKIRRRNFTEYAACVLVVIGFTPSLLRADSWLMQLGSALVILAVGYVAWQLHRRGSARPGPETGAALADFHRSELVRQRDALRSVASWYLAPFAPGMLLIMAGRWFQSHVPGRPLELDRLIIALCMVIVALVFFAVWLLNRLGAHRLQKEIDALDALRG